MQKIQITHLYIGTDRKISGGSPIVKGTSIRVVDIAVEYEYLNHKPDEIVNAHPHLKLKEVHDALSYYYENRRELDEKIRKDRQFIKELSNRKGEG